MVLKGLRAFRVSGVRCLGVKIFWFRVYVGRRVEGI